MIQVVIKPDILQANLSMTDETHYYIVEGMRWRMISKPRLWRPPTDVYETEDEIIVRVEIAGMRESDFSIALYGRILSISGVRSDTNARRAYHRMEIPFGEFAIEIDLPFAVDENKVQATYETGFLIISLPKVRPQSIRIEE